MKPKRLLFVAAAVLTILILPIGWYLVSPLFITRAVNEDFPVAQVAALPAQTDVMPEKTVETMASEANDAMQPKAEASMASKLDQPMTEKMTSDQHDGMMHSPAATAATADAMQPQADEVITSPTVVAVVEPQLLLSGQFHAVEHRGTGMAAIYELPDGQRVLRLENFDVLNGPDLYVWLSGAMDANNSEAIRAGGYFEVARLKGNTGNQNYELPADLDLSKYHSVTIWCRQFGVNFATAPLQ